MSFFNDDELNNMFNDWERRMRARREQMGEDFNEDKDSLMGNIKNITPFGDDFSKMKDLGEPDSVEEFEEGGINFIKRIWNTENGDYVMIETVLDDEGNLFTGPMSLDEQLEEALEEEEYEKAAELRDKIAEKKVNDSLFKK